MCTCVATGPGTYVVAATWRDDDLLRYNPDPPYEEVDLESEGTNDTPPDRRPIR